MVTIKTLWGKAQPACMDDFRFYSSLFGFSGPDCQMGFFVGDGLADNPVCFVHWAKVFPSLRR
jgi:hypothetical protein